MISSHEELLLKLAAENPKAKPDYEALLLPLYVELGYLLSHLEGGKLLDVGCAYGTQSAFFAALGYKVKAVDAMELADAEWLKGHGVSYSLLNLETDPLPEASSDVIVLSEVLEHLCYNPYPSVRKLYAALRPGGTLLLTTPRGESAEHRRGCTGRYGTYLHWRDIPEPWNGYRFEDAHHHVYTARELVQLLHEAGFSVTECYPIYQGKSHYVQARKPR